MVSASASAFMCATIRTRPSRASVTTAVISPFASKRGASALPSSSAVLSDGGSENSIGGICRPSGRAGKKRRSKRSAAIAVPHHGYEPELFFGTVPEHTGKGGGERGGSLFTDT